MSKDPAVLLYTSDFLSGCQDLTMMERGQYITLLCLQHQKGVLSPKIIKLTCGNEMSQDVLDKFKIDKDGNYYNERMNFERNKRKAHSELQRQKAQQRWDKVKKEKNNSNKQLKGDAVASTVASALVVPLEIEIKKKIQLLFIRFPMNLLLKLGIYGNNTKKRLRNLTTLN